MPDLFGNVTSQLPPWLTNQPTGSQLVDKAFQAKQQAFSNFSELSQLNIQQRQQAQREELAPLLMEAQQQRITLAKQDIAIGAAKVYDEIESSGMTAKVAGLRLLAAKSPNGFADPSISTALDEAAIKWPSIVKSPLWQQTRQDVNVAKQFVQQRELRQLSNDRMGQGMQAAETFNRLMGESEDAFDNGDFELADKLKAQAEPYRDLITKRGTGGTGAPRAGAATEKINLMKAADKELADAIASGDEKRIAAARRNLQITGTQTKMPGMTDSSYKMILSSRSIPERKLSNATTAMDQVNDLISTVSGGSVGIPGILNAGYQKLLGDVLPGPWGDKAISDQSKLGMLRNSLQAMASADRSRSAALLKEIDVLMPSTGVDASGRSTIIQLENIRPWVAKVARQSAIDQNILPPYWAMTAEDAADAVIQGEKALKMGIDPESTLFKSKYLTTDEYLRIMTHGQPSNAPIQLPNPPQ